MYEGHRYRRAIILAAVLLGFRLLVERTSFGFTASAILTAVAGDEVDDARHDLASGTVSR